MFDLTGTRLLDEGAAFWNGVVPALELALATYVKNQDEQERVRVGKALARIGTDAAFDSLHNETLAGLIGSYLRAYLLTRDEAYRAIASRVVESAKARFDDKDCYFKPGAGDTSKRFRALENALLGEAFYFGWRVLEDQTLRPIAGEMLGQLSAFFDPSPRFSDVEPAELEIDERERRELRVSAAAMQLFLTASETTGRRSYMPRAAIVADAALTSLKTMRRDATAIAEFARALLRLEQFTGETRYGSAAQYLVGELQTPESSEGAIVALARREAEHYPLHVVVIGDVEEDAAVKELWLAALCEYAPARAIELLHPTQHAVRIEQLGYAASRVGVAYVCAGTVCLPAVGTVEDLRNAVQRARALG